MKQERNSRVRWSAWLGSNMEKSLIDISKLDKAEVLAALYNNSKQQGMGFLHARGQTGMTKQEAADLLKNGATYFDYLHGRVMKVELKGNTLDPRLYDRDNGEGSAAEALKQLAVTVAA